MAISKTLDHSMTNPKKRLLCIIAHEPLFEICYPILARLNQRKNIDLDVYISKRLVRLDPRYHDVFTKEGLMPKIRGRVWLEFGLLHEILRCDAIIGHADLTAKPRRYSLRDKVTGYLKKKTIFIQHGLQQPRVNWPDETMPKVKYYSDQLLLWDQVKPWEYPFLEDGICKKISVIGYPKKNLLPEKQFSDEFLKFSQQFTKRLLICTTFTDTHRFSNEDQQRFFEWLDLFCHNNPTVLTLYRPHRGRQYGPEKTTLKELDIKHKNLLISDRHSGYFRYSTINDCLNIVDFCIAHSGTAILDSIYFGIPTAVLQNQWPPLAVLPQIQKALDIETFLNNPKDAHEKSTKLLEYYGETDDNLNRSSRVIEDFIQGL